MHTSRLALIEGVLLPSTLAEAAETRDLGVVYHGTPYELDYLEPRNTFWVDDGLRYADCDRPVICATENLETAAFRAITPRDRTGQGYFPNKEGGITYYVNKIIARNLHTRIGFISILDRDDFSPFDGKMPRDWPGEPRQRIPEYRSDHIARPLCNLLIDLTDFEEFLSENPTSRLEIRNRSPY